MKKKQGKITRLLSKIRKQNTFELIERFKHLAGVQAIKSYIAAKPDTDLDIEVRLTGEELLKRLKKKSPSIIKVTKI